MRKNILNIGGGNKQLKMDVNIAEFVIDSGLNDGYISAEEFDDIMRTDGPTIRAVLNDDLFEFLSGTSYEFDGLVCNRVLEHISYDQIGYFSFLMYRVLRPGAKAEFIVPNAEVLCNMYLDLSVQDSDYFDKKMVITTEFCNTASDPHLSLWRPDEIKKHFIDISDDYWELDTIIPTYPYEGRNLYMYFSLIRK